MRNIRNLSHIKTIIRHAGLTVKNSPSIDHPIPVAVFYRNTSQGTVSWFWPRGNRQTALAKFCHSSRTLAVFYSLVFTLGLEGILAHGKLVVYTDLPTATYLQQLWKAE